MNYQHIYHAGSAADVFKHTILLNILHYYQQKTKPFCVIDTHAGAGSYNLTNQREWLDGLGLVQKAVFKHPVLRYYQKLNADLTCFAGSPWLIKQQLRSQDKAIFIEQIEAPYRHLTELFKQDVQIKTYQNDAWLNAKTLLPPLIRRGIVLIDPPYENQEDFKKSLQWLAEALQRWSVATYLLWYPIKSYEKIQQWYRHIPTKLSTPFTLIECLLWPVDVPNRLNGSGLLIVNPPWQLLSIITPMMHELMDCLKQHSQSQWRIT